MSTVVMKQEALAAAQSNDIKSASSYRTSEKDDYRLTCTCYQLVIFEFFLEKNSSFKRWTVAPPVWEEKECITEREAEMFLRGSSQSVRP